MSHYKITESTLSTPCDYFSTHLTDILKYNEHNLNRLVQDSIYGVWIISLDQTTLFTNPKLAQILGYTVEEIQTIPFWRFIDQHHPVCQVLNCDQVLIHPEEYELKLLHKQGHWVWVRLSLTSLVDTQDQCQGYLLKLFDLTYLKQIEEQLRQRKTSEEALSHLLKVIRNSGSLQRIFVAAVDELGYFLPAVSVQILQYVAANQTWINRAEYQDKSHKLKDKKHFKKALNSADSDNKVADKNVKALNLEKLSLPLKISTGKPQTSELVIDDEQIEDFLQYCPGAWLPIPLYCESSIWGCLSLVMQDPQYQWQTHDQTFIQMIADQLSIAIYQAELQQELEQARLKFQSLSTLDPLTQLPNRYCFDQHLSQVWQDLSYHQRHLTISLCHVDSFSYDQKTHGDHIANQCLKQIAFIIRSNLTDCNQMVARYGQAEFALLLPNTEPSEAMELIENLQTEIEQLKINLSTAAQKLTPTVSFGMASIIPQLGLSAQQLLANAEQALDKGASPLCKCLLA